MWESYELRDGNEFKAIEILLVGGKAVTFTAKYRRDLEKPNWHYYEKEDGKITHIRKEHMIIVDEL